MQITWRVLANEKEEQLASNDNMHSFTNKLQNGPTYWLNFFYVGGELDETESHDAKVGNNEPDQGEPPSRRYKLPFY